MQVFAIAYFYTKIIYIKCMECLENQEDKYKIYKKIADYLIDKYKKNDMVLFNDMCTQF